jgi:hypothetical protein
MWQVVGVRVIAGLRGADMTVIVAVLITDLCPMIDVAPWRSYVDSMATTGRMIIDPSLADYRTYFRRCGISENAETIPQKYCYGKLWRES